MPFGPNAAHATKVSIADFSSFPGEGNGFTLRAGSDMSHPFDFAMTLIG